MMLGLAVVLLLAPSSSGTAGDAYLTCTLSSGPPFTIGDLYRTPPQSQTKFAKDVYGDGSVGLILAPSNTWIISGRGQTIRGGSSPLTLRIRELTDTEIVARTVTQSGYIISVHIDRISGVLDYMTIMPQADIQAWKSKHGKAHPSVWTWTQRCTASSTPKL